jgi:hypothetical protein
MRAWLIVLEQRLLLPLLWSTFSARQAITEQQLVGFKQIVAGLRSIRGRRFYRSTPQVAVSHKKGSEGNSESGSDRDTVKASKLGDSLLIEEMSEAGRVDLEAKQDEEKESLLQAKVQERNTFLHFRPGLEELPSLLDDLGTNLSATSTTRTSLLSTLASYNSQLHTQDFVSNTRGGRSRGGVGLNTLDENLAKEAGRSGSGGLAGGESEDFVIGRAAPEFEELRKEVRGLKGLLLSRQVGSYIHVTSTRR